MYCTYLNHAFIINDMGRVSFEKGGGTVLWIFCALLMSKGSYSTDYKNQAGTSLKGGFYHSERP